MLVLLLTFAVLLGTSFGQSSDTACPTLKEVHSSQEALASQLRDVLAKYNRQQSSESLTNILQLMLVKQLMAEMDPNIWNAKVDKIDLFEYHRYYAYRR